MTNLLHASRLANFGRNLGGRNYDYTKMYDADKLGEGAKENARAWYVYLDEAESHDADMIEGYRSILDSLLVFAALFSAVVTTFVAQTSQALQPDNAQIMVSLLVETNQLLRAAGNRTSIEAVPAASLGPESQTHTSKDVWVNGLFFTSLALSLSAALLSVLAKQWIQAYTVIVPGSARTRALIRQFRFDGLEKYRLGDIIQSLPLILHCSVVVFLVGLSLYVSELSSPICGVIAAITILTFLFYIGSSMIPALDTACPYRIPFVSYLTKPLVYVVYTTGYTCRNLWRMLNGSLKSRDLRRPKWLQRQSLAEQNRVSEHSWTLADNLAHNSFGWLFNHSSNDSVKQIVIEGTCDLFNEWVPIGNSIYQLRRYDFSECFDPLGGSRYPGSGESYLPSAILYSLSRLPGTCSASSTEDDIGESNKYGRMIKTLMASFQHMTLVPRPNHPSYSEGWREQILAALSEAYGAALTARHRVLSRWLLDLSGPGLFSDSKSSAAFLHVCAKDGDEEDFRELVHRGIDLDCRNGLGWTALHYVALSGNLDMAIALVERDPALISARNDNLSVTVLECAIYRISSKSHTMVTFLLAHGAQSFSHEALYDALTSYETSPGLQKVKLLLDCGWDRTVKDAKGMTLLDIARSKVNYNTIIEGMTLLDIARRKENYNTLIEYLEHYQTVRLAPYGMTSHTMNEETP